jgi:hypothetical protein
MSANQFPALKPMPESVPAQVKNMGAWSNGIDSIRKAASLPTPPVVKIVVNKKNVKEQIAEDSSLDSDVEFNNTWDNF